MAYKLNNRQLDYVIFFSSLIYLVTAAIYTNPIHNPDANLYYQVTLRLVKGHFWDSIPGITGPLLSWLLCLPFALGLTLATSFLVLQVILCLLIVLVTIHVSNRLDLHFLPKLIVTCITTMQCGAYGLLFVTPDVLLTLLILCTTALISEASFISSFKKQLWIVFLCMLCILAKPIGLFAVLLILILSFLFDMAFRKQKASKILKAYLCVGSLTLLLSSLWISILTIKYGVLNIGINLFFDPGILKVEDYSLNFDVKEKLTEWLLNNSQEKSPWIILNSDTYKIYHYTFTRVFAPLSFAVPVFSAILNESKLVGGQIGIFSFLLLHILFSPLIFKKGSKFYYSWKLYLIATGVFLSYALLVGTRIRYYIPAIIILNIILGFAISELFYRKTTDGMPLPEESNSFFRKLFASIAIIFTLSCFATIPYTMFNYNTLLDISVLKQVITLPTLQNHPGAITGRENDMNSGYIAAQLGREYPIPIRQNDTGSKDKFRKKLLLNNIEQAIFFDEPFKLLDEMCGVERDGPISIEKQHIYIYTLVDKNCTL